MSSSNHHNIIRFAVYGGYTCHYDHHFSPLSILDIDIDRLKLAMENSGNAGGGGGSEWSTLAFTLFHKWFYIVHHFVLLWTTVYFGQNVYFWIDKFFISIGNSSLIDNFYFQVAVTTTGMACDVATTWGVESTTGSSFVGAASLWKTPCKCYEFQLQVVFPDQ